MKALKGLPRALRTRWLHGQMRRLGSAPHHPAPARALQSLPRHGITEIGDHGRTMASAHRLEARIWAEPPADPTGRRNDSGDDESGEHSAVPGWSARISTPDDPHPKPAGAGVRTRRTGRSASVRAAPTIGSAVVPEATRRVQKLLAEHLPRHLRSAWPLFCENDMICWIPGVWQHSKPGDPNNRVVEVIRQ